VSWGSSAQIKAVDLSNFQVSTILTTSLGNIDGIDDDNDGNYYIASWSPDRITKYDVDFANSPETITTPFLNNPADIGYSKETDTLAIPMGNSVVFVNLGEDSISTALPSVSMKHLGLAVYPNPASAESYLHFTLSKSMDIQLELFNNQNQLVKILLNGVQSNGSHKVLFAGHNLSAGVYFARLSTEIGNATIKIIMK
jgi:hypothetical protein